MIQQAPLTKLGMSFNAARPFEFQELKAAGVHCVELNCRTLDIRKPEVLAKFEQWVREAEQAGIELWSYHLPYSTGWDPSVLDPAGRETAIENVSYVIERCAEWGISTLVYHPSIEPIPDADRAERLLRCGETLRVLADRAARHQITIAVECLPRTCLGNCSDEMLQLMEADERLMVCCDVNHLFKEPAAQFIRKIGSRLRSTHLSDHDGTDEKHWVPGEGIICWPDVIEALKALAYKGPLMYEVRDQTIDQVVTNWRGFMNRMISLHGKGA